MTYVIPADELLRIIARGVEVGHTGRLRTLSREEVLTKARDYCDAHGLSYAQSDLKVLRTDPPSSRKMQHA